MMNSNGRHPFTKRKGKNEEKPLFPFFFLALATALLWNKGREKMSEGKEKAQNISG